MTITICSRLEAASYVPRGRAALISISDTGASITQESWQLAYDGVLAMQFDDCFEDGADLRLISWDQAATIAAFIQKSVDSGYDELVVHCNAGLSRSPGVALAAAHIMMIDDAFACSGERRPNNIVAMRIEAAHNRLD